MKKSDPRIARRPERQLYRPPGSRATLEPTNAASKTQSFTDEFYHDKSIGSLSYANNKSDNSVCTNDSKLWGSGSNADSLFPSNSNSLESGRRQRSKDKPIKIYSSTTYYSSKFDTRSNQQVNRPNRKFSTSSSISNQNSSKNCETINENNQQSYENRSNKKKPHSKRTSTKKNMPNSVGDCSETISKPNSVDPAGQSSSKEISKIQKQDISSKKNIANKRGIIKVNLNNDSCKQDKDSANSEENKPLKETKEESKHSKNISNQSTVSNSNSNHVSGGLLRLNNESMKLLNQELKKESDYNMFQSSTDSAANMLFSSHGSASDNLQNVDYARRLIDKLTYLIKTTEHLDHKDILIDPLRTKLITFYDQMLLQDLNTARVNNALQVIWQSCFYPFIDYYRSRGKEMLSNDQKTDKSSDSVKRYLNLLKSVIDEGLEFFESLIQKLRSRYDFSYKSLIERRKNYDLNRSLFAHLQEVTYCVKIIFIYLGDLARYLEMARSRPNYELPKTYYMKAHMLVPKNAHACSQLALISYYQKNYFDAIYYYIRSFEIENNIDQCSQSVSALSTTSNLQGQLISGKHSNKQNLTVIFDEIRLCYDEHLKLVQNEHDIAMEKNKAKREIIKACHSRINKYYRIEYWVRPSGTIAKCDMYNFYDLAASNSNEDEPDLLQFYKQNILPNYTSKNLKKSFILSFLMVHGMLNCRIGLDRYFDVANQMILEFECLLNHLNNSSGQNDSNGLSSVRLIQLFVINMYTVANTYSEEDKNKNSAQYSFTHMNAYFIMSTMVIMVLQRLTALFDVFMQKHTEFIGQICTTTLSKMNIDSKIETDKSNRNSNEDKYEETNNDLEHAKIEDLFGSIGPSHSVNIDTAHNNENSCDSEPKESDTNCFASSGDHFTKDWKEFFTLLPCIKIWADWVISTKPKFPPHEMIDLQINFNENIWQAFAKFLTQLNKIQNYPINFYSDEKDRIPISLSPPKNINNVKYDYELVQLPEDRCLEGFKLILNTPESSKYIKLPFIPEIAYTYMRIASIQLFGDYLCGLKDPYLKYDSKLARFESRIESDDVEGCVGLKLKTVQEQAFLESMDRFIRLREKYDRDGDALLSDEEDDSGKLEEENEDEFSDDQEAIEELKRLNVCPSERRKLLQYRMIRKQNRKHGKYFKMIEHINEPKLRFVIRPRYVVLDTNCLINDLSSIKQIIQTVPFLVTIPLIVIHELEFISARGQRILDDLEMTCTSDVYSDVGEDKVKRFIALSKKANEILEFLKEAFDKYRSSVRAVTSKGSLVHSIEFREEFYNPDAYNNDDLVLYACTNLVKSSISQNEQTMRKLLENAGEVVSNHDKYVYRDVILITDDLNLRLKSLGYDIPVKKLRQFLKWVRTLER